MMTTNVWLKQVRAPPGEAGAGAMLSLCRASFLSSPGPSQVHAFVYTLHNYSWRGNGIMQGALFNSALF